MNKTKSNYLMENTNKVQRFNKNRFHSIRFQILCFTRTSYLSGEKLPKLSFSIFKSNGRMISQSKSNQIDDMFLCALLIKLFIRSYDTHTQAHRKLEHFVTGSQFNFIVSTHSLLFFFLISLSYMNVQRTIR